MEPPLEREALPRDTTFEALFAPVRDRPYLVGAERHPRVATPAFVPANAWWLAELALLAYVPEHAFVDDVLARAGFRDVEPFAAGSTHGFVADEVCVFRGTDDLDDLRKDLDAKLVPAEHGRVHRGFRDALELVWDTLEPRLCGRAPLLAGHSLGGALAVLAAARLPRVRAVYTFGAPRVGDAAFRDALDLPLHRVVNNNDLVPRLPPLPYRHAGALWYLDAGGRLRAQPRRRDRVREQLRGHAERARDNARRWASGDLASVPYDSLIDHAPLHYAIHLRNHVLAQG